MNQSKTSSLPFSIVADGNDSVKHRVKKELSHDGVFRMKEFPTGMGFGLCVFVLPQIIKDLEF